MKHKETNHTNKSPSLRGARMLKLSMECLTTRQSPSTIWDVDQRSNEGALISFSGMETVLALFSQPGVFVSFVGTKERGEDIRLNCSNLQPLSVFPLNLGERTHKQVGMWLRQRN